MLSSALIARAASGAVCGTAVASGRRGSGITTAAGAVLGGAFAWHHVRRQLSMKLNGPDPAVVVVEDMLAIGGAVAIVSRGASLMPFATRGMF